MKLGTKLFLGFIAIIVTFSIGLDIIYFQFKEIEENVGEMDRRSERALDLSEIRSLHRAKNTQQLDYILNPDDQYINNYNERATEQEELFNTIEPFMRTDEQKKLYSEVTDANQILNDTFLNQIVPAIQQGDKNKVEEINEAVIQPQRRVVVDNINSLIETVDAEKQQAITQSYNRISNSIFVLFIVTIISVLVGFGIAMFMGRKISNPIKEIQDISTRIADGDLTVEQLNIRSKDEIGQLTHAINV